MASSGQQVTLTVAKQGAVYHGLAMLICEEPPQSLPGMTEHFSYSIFFVSSSLYCLIPLQKVHCGLPV